MRTFTVELEGYEGEVELRMPRFNERFNYIKTASSQVNEKGEPIKSDTRSSLDALIEMVQYTLPFYVRVDLKNKTTGTEFKSVDDLDFGGDEGNKILIEVAPKLVNASSLGNSKKSP